MFYYVIFLCLVLFIAIYISSKPTMEGFNLGLSDKEKDAVSQMIQINNSFFGNLTLFKERSGTVYAYHKQDRNIYKCKEPRIFSKIQTNWEPIVNISSLNDYDVLDNNGDVIVIVSNNGMQFFRTSKKEFSDIFTNVIDTTYNNTFHLNKIINAKDVYGEGASSCSDLANKVNNKKSSDKLPKDPNTNEKVEYHELNADQCKKYAENEGIPYKTINNASYWPKGCLRRVSNRDVFFNLTTTATGNYRGNADKKEVVNICQTIETTQKLGEQMESPTNPKIFTISKMTFSLCCVGSNGNYILICDQSNKQMVTLKVMDLTRGVKVEYNSDIIRSTSELYIFRDTTKVYVLEGKLNHIYQYNFSDPENHTTIVNYRFWLDSGSKYGLTKEILEETKVYGIWKEGNILLIYGLFPGMFETENNRVVLFQFRIDGNEVKLEDMIRLPNTVFGSSLRTIYEPLGASNLYYKQKQPDTDIVSRAPKPIPDFILATNKSSNFLTFYGVKKGYEGETIGPVNTPPSDSNALDDLSDYSQYDPSMMGVDKYLMNNDNKDGSKEFREGEYIYFVMKNPIMFKGISMKTLNDVFIRAFELYVLRDGKTFSVSNQGNSIQDNEDNYKKIDLSGNSVYGKEKIENKPDEIDIYHVLPSVYTTVVKLKILKLNKINQEKEIGDFSTKFQGMLYGLKLDSLEDLEAQQASRNAECDSELKDVESAAEEQAQQEEQMEQIEQVLRDSDKDNETELADKLCNEYFENAIKYLKNTNITISDKRNRIEKHKKSIESCKILIRNKKEYADNNIVGNMKVLYDKQNDAIKKIKDLETAIENLNTDGSYLKGYVHGYDLLKTYVTKQVDELSTKYKKINPDDNESDVSKELIAIESEIDGLKTNNKTEEKCGNENYNNILIKINKYLKFTEMYNVLIKLMKDKVYDFKLSELPE